MHRIPNSSFFIMSLCIGLRLVHYCENELRKQHCIHTRKTPPTLRKYITIGNNSHVVLFFLFNPSLKSASVFRTYIFAIYTFISSTVWQIPLCQIFLFVSFLRPNNMASSAIFAQTRNSLGEKDVRACALANGTIATDVPVCACSPAACDGGRFICRCLSSFFLDVAYAFIEDSSA